MRGGWESENQITMEENEEPIEGEIDDLGHGTDQDGDLSHQDGNLGHQDGDLSQDLGPNQGPRPTQSAGNRGRRSRCKTFTVYGLVALLAASIPAALQA